MVDSSRVGSSYVLAYASHVLYSIPAAPHQGLQWQRGYVLLLSVPSSLAANYKMLELDAAFRAQLVSEACRDVYTS